ncbi:MAG: ABC transporter ATP-binding protein/permease [Lachnospiraceae bacterium]|nr:ABC transporter ATP-binding protein/permease [Lachnospiraceae bacterium]
MARNKYDIDEDLETPFDFRHLKRSFLYIKKYKGKMLGAFILSVAAAIAGLIAPLLTQKALDETIPDGDVRGLFFLALLLIIFTLVNVLLSNICSRILAVVGQDVIFDIRNDLFKHLQELPFTYYDDRPHGKILIRVINYVNSVSNMLSNGIISFILEILNMVFILGFMLFVDVRLTVVVLAGLPVFILVMGYIKNHQRKAWQDVSNKSSNMNAYLQENIVGVRVTRSFTRENQNAEIFDHLNDRYRASWMQAVKYSNLVWPATDVIAMLVHVALFVIGLLVFDPATVTLGTLAAMTGYASRFWQPIMNLSNIMNNFINNIAYLERIFETLDEPVMITDKEGAADIGKIRGDVSFHDVTFAYEKENNVLERVSFDVKAGESIALVGPTGAGKSTIVSLISRFYDIDSGSITIDGKEIGDVTLHSLRSQMGIMLQDSFIFSGTVMDNIRYGRLDATDEEVRKAAAAVCADEFISQMSDGYQTQVNERGAKLSGGEKQLISFARTLLSDPKILVLDEATSSIDAKTEVLVQKGLAELLKGRTSFIIAHRLSTIRNCDRIMFIDGRGITECGSHEELMAKKGDYYRLYMSQSA